MKANLNFLTMVLTLLAFSASCETIKENPKNEQQNDEPPTTLTVEGKQWSFTWAEMRDASAVLDLGVTTEGVLYVAYDMQMGGGEGSSYIPYLSGSYIITPTDATSGTITVTTKVITPGSETEQDVSIVLSYSQLTETSVKVECETWSIDSTMTLVEEVIEIQLQPTPGDQEPDDSDTDLPASLDGNQWSFLWAAQGKVRAIFDFGVTTDEVFYLAYDMSAIGGSGYFPNMSGSYTVTATDETSGTITVSTFDVGSQTEISVVISYSELTNNSVKIVCESWQINNTMTLVEEKIEVQL